MRCWPPLLCLVAAASPADAQDRSVMGDWRYLGRDPQNVYGWAEPGLREASGSVVVHLIRVPLAEGPFDHEVVTMRIDCEATTYRVLFATRYDADGRGPPMEIIEQEPSPIGVGPLAAVQPVACGDPSGLRPRPPVSAAAFALHARRSANADVARTDGPRTAEGR